MKQRRGVEAGGRAGARLGRAWLVALPVAVLVVATGAWTFTRGRGRSAVPTQAVAAGSGLAAVAIQQPDLPPGFQKCSYSADVARYLETIRKASPSVYGQVLDVWTQLKARGATGAYFAYWADSDIACASVLDPDEAGMIHGSGGRKLRTVFSIVVGFPSTDAAVSSYGADVFQHSRLKDSQGYEVTEGSATGLGANSIVGAQPSTTTHLRQAVWQNGPINVLYGSENLPIADSERVTSAVNRRIG